MAQPQPFPHQVEGKEIGRPVLDVREEVSAKALRCAEPRSLIGLPARLDLIEFRAGGPFGRACP